MAVPFKLVDIVARANEYESEILSEAEYSQEIWNDEILGPWLKAYALLTHFPEQAFDEPEPVERIAAYRTYAFSRLARLHVKRDGCDCMEVDGMVDLLTELDDIAGPEVVDAIKAGEGDANREIAKLKKAGKSKPIQH